MAIAQVGSLGSVISTANVTTCVLTCPASVTTGHILIVGINNVAATTASVTPPNGWQYHRMPQILAATTMAGVFWRLTDSTDVASTTTYTWTVASGQVIGVITAWSGVDTVAPFECAGVPPCAFTRKTTTSTTNTYPAIATLVNGSQVLGFAFGRNNATNGTTNSATTPTNYTELCDLQQTVLTGVNNATVQMVSQLKSTAGAVASATSTLGLSSAAYEVVFALRPASSCIAPSTSQAAISAWFRGDDLTGADASSITSWSEHSTASGAAVTGTAPTVAATVSRNGLKVGNFARASSQFLNFPGQWLPPCSLYVAFRSLTTATSQGLLNGQTAVTGVGPWITTGNVLEVDQSGVTNLGASSNTAGIDGWHVAGVTYLPDVPVGVGVTRINLDGVITSPAVKTNQPTNTAGIMGQIAANFWNGYIAEVIVYNGLHTPAESDTIVNYLQTKWVPSIPASKPYLAAVQQAALW